MCNLRKSTEECYEKVKEKSKRNTEWVSIIVIFKRFLI